MRSKFMLLLALFTVPIWGYAQEVTDITEQAQSQTPPAAEVESSQEAPVSNVTEVSAPVIAAASKPAVKISGSFRLQPIAYDAEDYYVGLLPAIDLDTTFAALGDKTMNVNFHWDLRYRAFIGTDQHHDQDMDFYNIFSVAADVDVADKLNASAFADIELGNRANDQGDNEIWVEFDPRLTYTLTPTTKIYTGYSFTYDLYPDAIRGGNDIDAGGPASEGGSGFRSLSSGFSNDDSGAFAFGSGVDASGSEFSNDTFVYWHEIPIGIKQTLSETTKASAEYKFGRFISNNDSKEVWENHFDIRVSQQAWKGATVGLQYRLRIFDFIYAVADDGVSAQRNFRNRIYVTYDQEVTPWFALEAFYRYQKTISNLAQAELDPGDRHQLWLGAVVKF